MPENQEQNFIAQEKLQMAMGLKKAPADFYTKAGIGEPQFRKWKMFFRGRGNTLMGVEILCDYLKERKAANGDKLPANLEIAGRASEKRFFKNYITKITTPNPTDQKDDKSGYMEELRFLGIGQDKNAIPEYVSKGLEFFGRIFADPGVGIVTHDMNQSKGRFTEALGFASGDYTQWIKKDDEIMRNNGAEAPGVLPGTSTPEDSFFSMGFGDEGQTGQSGGGLGVQEKNETMISLDITEEEEKEEMRQKMQENDPFKEPEKDKTEPEKENEPAPTEKGSGIAIIGHERSVSIPEPGIMESQLETQFPFGGEIPSIRLEDAPQIREKRGFGPGTPRHNFGRMDDKKFNLPTNHGLRMPIKPPAGTAGNPSVPQESSGQGNEEGEEPAQTGQKEQQEKQQAADKQEQTTQNTPPQQNPVNEGEEEGAPEDTPSHIGRYVFGGSVGIGIFYHYATVPAPALFLMPIITTLKLALIHLFSI